jgi:chromosomal replication initiator protein
MQSDLRGRPLTLDEVKDLTKNVTKTTKSVTFKDVLKAVALYYKIDEQMLIEKNRKQEISTPRQILMYLLREDFGNSLSSIGQKLGGRDHTTVLHACEKVGNEIKNNTTLIEEVGQIRSMFRV